VERRHFGAEFSPFCINRFKKTAYGRTKCHSAISPKRETPTAELHSACQIDARKVLAARSDLITLRTIA
jgi:hypothetical protein